MAAFVLDTRKGCYSILIVLKLYMGPKWSHKNICVRAAWWYSDLNFNIVLCANQNRYGYQTFRIIQTTSPDYHIRRLAM